MSADAREALLEALAGNRDAPVLDRLNAFEAAIRAAALDEARAALLEQATPGDDYDGTWSCIAAIDALREDADKP